MAANCTLEKVSVLHSTSSHLVAYRTPQSQKYVNCARVSRRRPSIPSAGLTDLNRRAILEEAIRRVRNTPPLDDLPSLEGTLSNSSFAIPDYPVDVGSPLSSSACSTPSATAFGIYQSNEQLTTIPTSYSTQAPVVDPSNSSVDMTMKSSPIHYAVSPQFNPQHAGHHSYTLPRPIPHSHHQNQANYAPYPSNGYHHPPAPQQMPPHAYENKSHANGGQQHTSATSQPAYPSQSYAHSPALSGSSPVLVSRPATADIDRQTPPAEHYYSPQAPQPSRYSYSMPVMSAPVTVSYTSHPLATSAPNHSMPPPLPSIPRSSEPPMYITEYPGYHVHVGQHNYSVLQNVVSERIQDGLKESRCWEHGCNGRTFSTHSNLLRHQREKNGKSSKSTCPKCGATFTRKTAMEGHKLQNKCRKSLKGPQSLRPASADASLMSVAQIPLLHMTLSQKRS